jgi:orotidine-5'-phosphate decarboxylase
VASANPLIVALDVESAGQALELVAQIGDAIDFYKVGMELFAAEGMPVVEKILALDKKVFLDMKYYDIGETVKRAVARVAASGVHFLTVHGAPAVMRAAVEGRGNSRLKILGVTVLTSWDDNDLKEAGYALSMQQVIQNCVKAGVSANVDGFICSPLEVARVRQFTGPQSILVTPGVRSRGAAVGDQKRVATPAEAMAAGANFLVLGRQITRAENPRAAALEVQKELQARP